MTRDLTLEEAKALLDLMRAKGDLTDKMIEELMSSAPLTGNMRAAVYNVHVLACRKNHADSERGSDRADGVECCFYREENFDNPWKGKDHQTWLRETMTLMKELGIESEDELLEFLSAAADVAGQVSHLAGMYKASMKFIRRIIIVPTPQ